MEPDEYDKEEGLTCVDLAVKFLQHEGAIHASSTQFHSGVWYSTEFSVIDYSNGTEEERSFHLYGFTEEEERAIWHELVKYKLTTVK